MFPFRWLVGPSVSLARGCCRMKDSERLIGSVISISPVRAISRPSSWGRDGGSRTAQSWMSSHNLCKKKQTSINTTIFSEMYSLRYITTDLFSYVFSSFFQICVNMKNVIFRDVAPCRSRVNRRSASEEPAWTGACRPQNVENLNTFWFQFDSGSLSADLCNSLLLFHAVLSLCTGMATLTLNIYLMSSPLFSLIICIDILGKYTPYILYKFNVAYQR
jgi:hypothetical protein